MTQDQAETLALKALGWLAGNDELLPIFLGASGTALEDLKTRAGEPVFLLSVLEFLTMDDEWVMAFCDAHALPYAVPMQALQALPGGAQTNWT